MSEASILDLINQWLVEHNYRKVSSLRYSLNMIIRRREHVSFLLYLSEETGIYIPEGYESFEPTLKDIVNYLLTREGLQHDLYHRRPTRDRYHYDSQAT